MSGRPIKRTLRGRPPRAAQCRLRARAPPCCSYSTRISWTPASSGSVWTCVCMSAGGVRRITSSPSSQTSRRSSPAPCNSTSPASGTYQNPCQRTLKKRRGSVGSSSRKSSVTSALMSSRRGVPVKPISGYTRRSGRSAPPRSRRGQTAVRSARRPRRRSRSSGDVGGTDRCRMSRPPYYCHPTRVAVAKVAREPMRVTVIVPTYNCPVVDTYHPFGLRPPPTFGLTDDDEGRRRARRAAKRRT